MRKGHFIGPNSRFKNITGQRFGMLVAVRLVEYNKYRRQIWEFFCDCGVICVKERNQVTTPRGTKSCGCDQFGHGNKKHGQHGTREYRAWKAMRQRCNDPNFEGYHNYGGRGITVCAAWDDFSVFLDHIGLAPLGNLTVERIENHGNYEPGNVRWATRMEQNRNRRDNIVITYRGRTTILKDWAVYLKIPYLTLYQRIRRGWPVHLAFTLPVGTRNWKSRPF